MKNSLNICGFLASRTRSGGDKSTVAPVFVGTWGCKSRVYRRRKKLLLPLKQPSVVVGFAADIMLSDGAAADDPDA